MSKVPHGGEAHDTTARLCSELGEAIANLLVDGDTASGIHQLTASEAWFYDDVADVRAALSVRNVA